MRPCLAYFVSPHGFGHAARACSVMEALHKMDSGFRFVIFSTVPEWFFTGSLSASFQYVELLTDIGLVQNGPLHEDIPATLEKLDAFYPLRESFIQETAEHLVGQSCDLIINDITPLGIAVGKETGIPTLLIENFTWDWIYKGYRVDGFARFIAYLEKIYKDTDYHMQAQPFCEKSNTDLICKPIGRKSRIDSRLTRSELGIKEGEKLVLLTMGGVREDYKNLDQLQRLPQVVFVIPGSSSQASREGNILFLPFQSGFYHPDLIKASDAIVGKVGYSTLAEIYQCGKPFGYIPREGFRESDILVDFIRNQMMGREITETEFRSGNWLHGLDSLLTLPSIQRKEPSGAEQAAGFIRDLTG